MTAAKSHPDHVVDSSRRASGFSSLELMIVLAIVALTMTVALPRLNPRLPNLDATAAELAAGLKALRAQAIGSNREEIFTFDTKAKSYVLGRSGRVVTLPSNLAVDFTTAREKINGQRSATLLFYPTGGSSGGRISLSLPGRRSDIVVDWMTGSVSIEKDRL